MIERIGGSPHYDKIGFTDWYDFSKSNMSEELRIEAVTTVASICYQSNKKINSKVLYDRLAGESIGLPSSSFEFVPILLTVKNITDLQDIILQFTNYVVLDIMRFGEFVVDNGVTYLLTNLRAWLSSIRQVKEITTTDEYDTILDELNYLYNTEDDCAIIRKHFYVFKHKVDLNTRSQMVRHRMASWQELSRRYVSGSKVPFDFYLQPKMYEIGTYINIGDTGQVFITAKDILNISTALYDTAVKSMPAQDARRLIPQAMYTELWSAWMPRGLNNFLDLRLDKHAQAEIREVAECMEFYTEAFRSRSE